MSGVVFVDSLRRDPRHATRGSSLRPTFRAATILTACALLTAPLLANEPFTWTLQVNNMHVLVSYVTTDEILLLHRRHGKHVDLRDIRQHHRRGFSILRTNRETGVRTCEIYIPNEHRPAKVDDDGTMTLGHELLHCMIGDYHR